MEWENKRNQKIPGSLPSPGNVLQYFILKIEKNNTWDQCYWFKKMPKNSAKNWRFLVQNTAIFANLDNNICFLRKTLFFRRKLGKIA
jgi:hypothetical protein